MLILDFAYTPTQAQKLLIEASADKSFYCKPDGSESVLREKTAEEKLCQVTLM